MSSAEVPSAAEVPLQSRKRGLPADSVAQADYDMASLAHKAPDDFMRDTLQQHVQRGWNLDRLLQLAYREAEGNRQQIVIVAVVKRDDAGEWRSCTCSNRAGVGEWENVVGVPL